MFSEGTAAPFFFDKARSANSLTSSSMGSILKQAVREAEFRREQLFLVVRMDDENAAAGP